MLKYSIVSHGDEASITIYHDGAVNVMNESHINYQRVHSALGAGDDELALDLFDIGGHLTKQLNKVSERVSLTKDTVYFDGVAVDNLLTRTILKHYEQRNGDLTAIVNFMEKLMTNNQDDSRNSLYKWLSDRNFTITTDGNFIAYKGVQIGDNDVFKSTREGTAWVDGVEHTGFIPNPIGATVEMPRDQVQHDPAKACAAGLHAGTFNYARDFGTKVLNVSVNPRDVVSVPNDSSEKMRVCRYVVLALTDTQDAGLIYNDDDDYNYPDDDYNDIDYPEPVAWSLRLT